MKKFFSFAISLATVITVVSCNDPLGIKVDPLENVNVSVSTDEKNLTVHFKDAQLSGEVRVGDYRTDQSKAITIKEIWFNYGTNKEDMKAKIKGVISDDGRTFYAKLASLEDGARYYYQAFAKVEGTEFSGNILTFTTLPEGPVDLDLESGVKWASQNLGATYADESGKFFAWGEIKDKSQYIISSYAWCDNSYEKLTKYCCIDKYNFTLGKNKFHDDKVNLDPSDDAAIQILGGSWRMPTPKDCKELIEKCMWTKATINGVYGHLVCSKKDQDNLKKRIFIPCAGYITGVNNYDKGYDSFLWTSEINNDSASYNDHGISLRNSSLNGSFSRWIGMNIRPVC